MATLKKIEYREDGTIRRAFYEVRLDIPQHVFRRARVMLDVLVNNDVMPDNIYLYKEEIEWHEGYLIYVIYPRERLHGRALQELSY
jgi:hypothetical protein